MFCGLKAERIWDFYVPRAYIAQDHKEHDRITPSCAADISDAELLIRTR